MSKMLYRHKQKNIALIVLSLILLPFDTFVLLLVLMYEYFIPSSDPRCRNAARSNPSFKPKTVLVTGVGMSKGLVLARSFYQAGHNVLGADFDRNACGRVSKAISKFYTLRKPTAESGSAAYIQGLLEVVLSEEVDLWVSCSGVASATEDGEAKEIIEARTSCRAIQFDVPTTQTLHEKHSFIARTQSLGLDVPETHTITDCRSAEKALGEGPSGRKYIMKPIGMDDVNRGDLTLLPKDTEPETAKHLSKLEVSEKAPWIMQQFIEGPEYCTHSLVIKGHVKAFVACPSAELLMHYEALRPDSKLSQAMLKFTQRYATAEGKDFTGHLSFDFMVDRSQVEALSIGKQNAELVLYPIECNPRAHTAVVLFRGIPGLPKAYLSLLDNASSMQPNGKTRGTESSILTPQQGERFFWIGHDLVELVVLPLLSILFFMPQASMLDCFQNMLKFVDHAVNWKDGTFERWDPAPWWWLYHIYWPMQFWLALTSGEQWSRINVSTTKVFKC